MHKCARSARNLPALVSAAKEVARSCDALYMSFRNACASERMQGEKALGEAFEGARVCAYIRVHTMCCVVCGCVGVL